MTTQQKGELATLRVMLRAVERGVLVSRPVLEGSRYDLVLDDGTRLYRAQVKYASADPDSGRLVVELKKHSGGYRRRLYTYSEAEIDVVVVYVPDLESVLWLPAPLWAGKVSVALRLTPPRNGQVAGCSFAADYIW